MNPIYLDLHIHTSENPNNLNKNYDLDTLISKVKEKANGEDFLISFTDHNVINEKVYLEALQKIKKNLIVGVELHIQTHQGQTSKAYHCHIYFNFDEREITLEVLQDLNTKLNSLYSDKVPTKTDPTIPIIQTIIETFDDYDFILLPHGGQTHATFDMAMPDGKEFDNVMQRSIYYNFFDGFTSRSDKKTEKTREYLERLGLHEFVNLLTCTDNYNPAIYPNPKNEETYKYIPTWMFATATFGGLRISLTDNSRLIYSHEKPRKWKDSIEKIKLKNDFIDIDIQLLPGLNVIIGESSSGKTLLVDSLYRKLTEKGFEDSKYREFGVENIEIIYPDKLEPHFLAQNFVTSVTLEDKKINDIEIIAKILPENSDARKKVKKGLQDLNLHLTTLFNLVNDIEDLISKIHRIPILSSLIVLEDTEENILKEFLRTISSLENSRYTQFEFEEDLENLNKLDKKLEKNPFINHDKDLIENLKKELEEMKTYSSLEETVKKIIKSSKDGIDILLEEKEGESQLKKQDFELLITLMQECLSNLLNFDQTLNEIANYSIEAHSETLIINGYSLSIENNFKLNKEIVLNELNKLLLKEYEISDFDSIKPSRLFKSRFKANIKGTSKGSGADYKLIVENINENFVKIDEIKYKIFTPTGKDFDQLSPGLKTAIILELILNFEEDRAPLVIDQPEDNLATSYMNEGLVNSIKLMKSKKQIIFVSHNATIPMAGDAQNVILCENVGNQIVIKSNPLEGKINDIDVVDHIARIADGGKSSIKKRFKKYNLKKYK